MPEVVKMPELGESIVEGTITKWLKAEGDSVTENEDIVEIMTDKVNTTLPAPVSGILTQIIAKEGDVVEVTKPLAVISPAGEAATSPIVAEQPSQITMAVSGRPDGREEKQPQPAGVSDQLGDFEGRWYSPVVQRMARESRVSAADLARISGTGTGGRVTKRDLQEFIRQRPAAAMPVQSGAGVSPPKPVAQISPTPTPRPPTASEEIVPLTGIRKVIADQMTRSYLVPQVTTVLPVDVSRLMDFRARNKDGFEKDHGVRLTFTPFFAKAVSEALVEFPFLNAIVEAEQVRTSRAVNLGVAVSLGEQGDGGLIVPVIHGAESKSLVDLARELDAIAKKARKSLLGAADIQGGTFTLSNPGSYGAVIGTPILNAPQTGILGTYAITQQPVVKDNMIGIRSIMNLALTYDHRIVDGMYAGRFLQKLKGVLENAEFLK